MRLRWWSAHLSCRKPWADPYHSINQDWMVGNTPVFPTVWKWKQEDPKFKVIFYYTVSLKPVWVAWDPTSKNLLIIMYKALDSISLKQK